MDLVIIDKKTHERTAVQSKHWTSNVKVEQVRELKTAKRNYGCILCLLITSSDLTTYAKNEAEKYNVDYWHGATLELKLQKWGKWKPQKQRGRSVAKQVAATVEQTNVCKCGVPMVKRRNREGQYFWGCSTYPKCNHTQSI